MIVLIGQYRIDMHECLPVGLPTQVAALCQYLTRRVTSNYLLYQHTWVMQELLLATDITRSSYGQVLQGILKVQFM